MSLNAFVLKHLPPPPARILEVGCGRGELAVSLADTGYEVLAIDPRAPEGEIFRQIALDELEEPASFDAAIAARVLHHVHPLGAALDKLARLAPILILDEFAWERMDAAAQDWYEGQYRILVAAGREPDGPRDLDHWRREHADLHPGGEVLRAAEERFDRVVLEPRPYLYRWLRGEASEALEQALVDARAIAAIGYRWVGRRR